MIPAVFSPYADRTPKLRRVSLRNDWAQCCTQAACRCGWGTSKPRGSPPRVRSMQEGVVDEEVAAPASLRTAHAARNGARVQLSVCRCFSSLPSIEERRDEPSRGRETRQTVTKGSAAPSSQKPATSTYLISGFRAIFAAGFRGLCCPRRRGGAAHDTLPPGRAALDAHAPQKRAALDVGRLAQAKQDGNARHARRRRPPPPLPEC